MTMDRPFFDPNSATACLHGSSAGMIPLPEKFQTVLMDHPPIAPIDIDGYSISQFPEQHVLHQGFIYKRGAENRVNKVTQSVGGVLPLRIPTLSAWQLRYVIIYGHFVIYYKNDTSKKPLGKFSLRDYNRVVRAEEMLSADRKWPFKVIGMRSSARTWYFCAASEKEMKLWMACFKVTMDHAIHGKVKQTCLDIITTEQARCSPIGYTDESLTSASSSGSGGDRFYQDTETYEDLESPTTEIGNEELDENYDDIAAEGDDDESLHSGGSGGRPHASLTGTTSASSNVIYEIQRLNKSYVGTSSQDSSYGADYLAILPDEPYSGNFMDSSRAGKRINSDPAPRHYRNHSPDVSRSDSRTTPQTRRRILPNSPGSRPKFPEPGFYKEDYDEPGQDVPVRQPPPPPGNRLPPKPNMRPILPVKGNLPQISKEDQWSRQTNDPPPNNNQIRRPAPDGNSFRSNRPVEKPRVLPRPSPSPKPGISENKPLILPKPPLKMGGDLLPESAVLKTSDKAYSESFLRKHNYNGMYVLRGSARDSSKQVIMVWDEKMEKSKHYTIFGDQMTSFALDQNAQFASLIELVKYYQVNYLPNTTLKLTRPCPG